MIRRETGLPVEIIDAEEEARLAGRIASFWRTMSPAGREQGLPVVLAISAASRISRRPRPISPGRWWRRGSAWSSSSWPGWPPTTARKRP
ncbi:hypothetical protein [Paracoccus sp. APAP_BH8]|uniref:hypothetical protein n=1 Tax=Paracoccus sp. APAP_BH8 TaxID=3110237 RepID=UPI003FA7809C